jgi:hypothetical protein
MSKEKKSSKNTPLNLDCLNSRRASQPRLPRTQA